jgi:phosphoserine phosphatase RsbU/P
LFLALDFIAKINYNYCRMKTEESLAISPDLLNRLVDGLPYMLLLARTDSTVVLANECFCKATGCTREYLVGNTIKNCNKPSFMEFIKNVIGSEGKEGVLSLQDAQGATSLWFCSFNPVYNEKKETVYYLFSGTDISIWKEQEQIAGKSAARLQSILQNINEYIYSVEYENGIPKKTYHSARCTDVTGYTPSEFEKDPELWFNVIYPDDRNKVIEFLDSVGKKQQTSYIEHRIVHKKGWVRWVANSYALHRDLDGTILRMDGFIQDISVYKETIERLRMLSIAVEQSPSSVVVTDQKGDIEYVNPKFTMLTGYTYPEVLGQNPRLLKSGQMSPENYKILWETILSGNEWRGEFHNKKKNGELYWELASISPLRNGRGDVTHFIAVKEDITKRKEVEEALRIRNETMEEDLRYAQSVQTALLPSGVPESDLVKISHSYVSLDMVGGDYYSFFINEKGTGVFIGDIAGHGVPAALFLSLIRFATENIARKDVENPDIFLSRLNEVLCRHMKNYFITASYGYFSKKENGVLFTYANGAHPAFILQRASGGSQSIKGKGGILGSFPGKKYHKEELCLQRGDRIFYYTDGLPEMRNVNDEIIGYDSMARWIEDSRKATIEETCSDIMKRAKAFRGERHLEDDIVLIGCEVK